MTRKLPVGVHDSKGGGFRSIITVNGKQFHLGVFDDVETAAMVRKQSKKMTDELISRLGKTEFIEVPVPEYIIVARPSIWSRFKKWWGKERE